jgi:hypothetical protein
VSNFKQTEFAKIYESIEYCIKDALSKIEDIRYSVSEMQDAIGEIADISEKLKDIFDADDD